MRWTVVPIGPFGSAFLIVPSVLLGDSLATLIGKSRALMKRGFPFEFRFITESMDFCSSVLIPDIAPWRPVVEANEAVGLGMAIEVRSIRCQFIQCPVILLLRRY